MNHVIELNTNSTFFPKTYLNNIIIINTNSKILSLVAKRFITDF